MSQITETVALSQMQDGQILEYLKKNKIGLTVEEAKKVEVILGRAPTLTELIVWGIQGSEHCSYRSSRSFLKTLPVSAPNVMLGVGEDSGIAEFATDKQGRKYGVIMAHESHNHPSQVVPYEGAATGVGGIVRDVLCMGGKVIATADPLRFGTPDRALSRIIANDVFAGIAGYGNPLGVPNIAGDIYFDESFNDNCLVNVLCLGEVREDEIIHSRVPPYAEGYDIIIIGKPTDNSGMGGAAFASLGLDEKDKEANKGAVQEPNPFLERHILESTYNLFAKLQKSGNMDKVAFKDMGAGGNVCATVELVEAGGFGADVDISKVHTSMDNLHPSIIACAETQERLCWICDPSLTQMILDHYNKEWDLPNVSVGARASLVGKVKKGNYTLRFGDRILVDALPSDVTRGLQYAREYKDPNRKFEEPNFEQPDLLDSLKKLLASENISSRLPVFEGYDKVVQGQAILQSGMADAGVIAPFKNRDDVPELHNIGAALSVDATPRYGKISPYWCAVNAVVESMRNVAAVGATPWAATDCLNYGNPEKPEQMWELVEGIRGIKDALEGVGHLDFEGPLAIISGNVSLYNESKNGSVAPSPVIGMLGRIEDARKAVTLQLKKPDTKLFLLGERKDELGGSEYYRLNGHLGANVPKPDFGEVRKELQLVTTGINKGTILSAHDISDGGLAVCLAEMCFGGRGRGKLGLKADIGPLGHLRTDTKLFTESGGFVVETAEENALKSAAEKLNLKIYELGSTTEEDIFEITENGQTILKTKQSELRSLWLNGLRNTLNS
ncbi:phosphoribosylformylglycinamidine synthase subunit PurL [Candidatus Peregrinibacteria bacterium]|nr:phosphoribosylformylglycinamidine synthase subunit PurL [Candidatus Peregrinibacteria bacterium]